MTRAVYAMLEGRVGEAFRWNPLGMILLAGLALRLGWGLVGWVRGRPRSMQLKIGTRGTWLLGGLVLIFWVMRNCPVWPCTLLAPP
jgi:hypothetical protein